MLPEIGLFALCFAFSLSTLGILGIGLFHQAYPQKALKAIQANAWGVISLSLTAFAIFVYSYAVCDFSLSSVVLHCSSHHSLFYRIAAVWSNHEGSMMLWLMFLQLTLMMLNLQNIDNAACKFWAILVQTGLIGLFLSFIISECAPFKRFFPVPLQGLGLNPALHDPSLGIHPPTLYSALVGYSGLFSLSIAGALSGQFSTPFNWANAARPWALFLWGLQTAGITLGSWWAYYELGWGGWWVWDPVENASLLPWLLGLGLLHCLNPLLLPKYPKLLFWLAAGPFLSAVLGTFLVRSGAISSLHAFAADQQRSLLLMGLFIVLGMALFFCHSLLQPVDEQSIAERKFLQMVRHKPLHGQLLLLAGCGASLIISFIVLLAFPTWGESALSLHSWYFKLTFMPFFLGLIAFIPWGYAQAVYTVVPWTLKKQLMIWGCFILLIMACLLIFPENIVKISGLDLFEGALGISIALWMMGASAIVMRERQHWNRLPGFLSHLGIGLFLLGATVQTFCSSSTTLVLGIGEQATFDDFLIKLTAITQTSTPLYESESALLQITKKQQNFSLQPENRFFPLQQRAHTKTAIHSLGFNDFYVAMGQTVNDPAFGVKYFFSVYNNCLIYCIWLGAFFMALGAFIKGFQRRYLQPRNTQ